MEPTFGVDQSKREGGGQESRHNLEPGLYLVATPIGNARDITLRALDVLGAADVIACEDTRETAKLLAIHGVKGALLAYHDHNAARMRPKLLARLDAGERVALVSDAGTPLVSDPGYKLVAAALAAGHKVIPVPGPSALLAALVASGLATDRFLFAGFLPARRAARRRALEYFAREKATLIFYESPARVAEALSDMTAILGDRPAAVAREITKKFETFYRGPLSRLAADFAAAAVKGEVVIVVDGAPAARGGDQESSVPRDIEHALDLALTALSVRDAAECLARATGVPKRTLYARALERRRGSKR